MNLRIESSNYLLIVIMTLLFVSANCGGDRKFRHLHTGMTEEQVKDKVGEPNETFNIAKGDSTYYISPEMVPIIFPRYSQAKVFQYYFGDDHSYVLFFEPMGRLLLVMKGASSHQTLQERKHLEESPPASRKTTGVNEVNRNTPALKILKIGYGKKSVHIEGLTDPKQGMLIIKGKQIPVAPDGRFSFDFVPEPVEASQK